MRRFLFAHCTLERLAVAEGIGWLTVGMFLGLGPFGNNLRFTQFVSVYALGSAAFARAAASGAKKAVAESTS